MTDLRNMIINIGFNLDDSGLTQAEEGTNNFKQSVMGIGTQAQETGSLYGEYFNRKSGNTL